MIQVFLLFGIICAALIIRERRIVRLIFLMGVFSLISSVCILLFAAPDVAMAEAVVSAFSTIIFIVCFEKYYGLVDDETAPAKKTPIRFIAPIIFTALLAALFIAFIPDNPPNTYLKERYLALFARDIGGENAVTAVYMGYRMYDTLFEALLLLVSIVAVIHLSRHAEMSVNDGQPHGLQGSAIAVITIRLICPVLLLFSVYLVMNGHISPGGGFQGGVMGASIFICRYMIYDIYDIQIKKFLTIEKLIYVGIILLTVLFIYVGLDRYLPIPKTVYLIMMNLLLGVKVMCGFFIVFYRFIAFERR